VGKAPDFGWQWTGSKAKWANDGVLVPMDKLSNDVGLDLSDFSTNSIDKCRYPQVDNQICSIPMDLMTLCPEVNTEHIAEAGLDPNSPPTDSDSLIDWGVKMTKYSGGKVSRSGILQTAASVQPNVSWDIGGLVCITYAFHRFTSYSSKISSFIFSQLLFAIILGYIFFGEKLDFFEIIGAILIVFSGVLVLIKKIQKVEKLVVFSGFLEFYLFNETILKTIDY